MIALSFRTKLLAAMFLLVLGVTGATLFVTQQKVQSTYQKLFQEQFEVQVNYFTEKQEARLSSVKEKCETLAKSVRLREAMIELASTMKSEGDLGPAPRFRRAREALIEKGIEDIYANAKDALGAAGQGPLRLGARPQSEPTGPAQPGRPMGEVFLRILDAKGQILQPPREQKVGAAPLVARRRLDRQLAFVGEAMFILVAQQTGYLAPEQEGSTQPLLEVIVTKISDSTTHQTLGALVLGFPLPDLAERTMREMSDILSGIWLDGEIHSRSIPEAQRASLAKLVGDEIKRSALPRDSFVVNVNGAPHRVFYKLLNPNSPFPPTYQVCFYSLSSSLKTQRDLRVLILGFAVLALIGAFSLSLLISHGLSVPIRELVRGTVEIQRGNFEVKVPVRSRDEIGQLAGSFNEMAVGLAQKEKYRRVLNMVADEKVADELMRGELALGGEVREVTMLFCDIRGFTALTQGMPPNEVIQLLNEHMTALTRVVYEHHGVVDKFVGDLIMALFGAPKSHGRDAENAARCALRIIEEREKLNQTSKHTIQVGIGVATGQVVAGCMGSSDRVDYTVLGDRVNLASRLCGQAKAGQVVIDGATRERLGDAIEAEPLPALTLKGFDGAVQAFRLVRFSSADIKT
jgi:class 3 adenylate cyclase